MCVFQSGCVRVSGCVTVCVYDKDTSHVFQSGCVRVSGCITVCVCMIKTQAMCVCFSLGVSEEDWNNQTGGLRGEAVHLRGTDEMSTKDVFDYFTEFPASGVEWINDTSCEWLC